MASNTGCVSVGEPLITCRISAVAACRSSASLSRAAAVLARSRACLRRARSRFNNGDKAVSTLRLGDGLARVDESGCRRFATPVLLHRRPLNVVLVADLEIEVDSLRQCEAGTRSDIHGEV